MKRSLYERCYHHIVAFWLPLKLRSLRVFLQVLWQPRGGVPGAGPLRGGAPGRGALPPAGAGVIQKVRPEFDGVM